MSEEGWRVWGSEQWEGGRDEAMTRERERARVEGWLS